MEVTQVLHMNKGEGATSYAKNSTVQRKIISISHSIIEEATVNIWCTKFSEYLEIADLGCSSGYNTLLVISKILDIVRATSHKLGRPLPEFRVSLNDLPTNDFNFIFQLLPAFYNKLKEENGGDFNPCFISIMPGSFYGRLFPTKRIHFFHSSSSLHWLSQHSKENGLIYTNQVPPPLNSKVSIPVNKGKIYISTTSPVCVWHAYSLQFQEDFSIFLKSRSEEMVPGGRMVLSFMGRTSKDPSTLESCFPLELLAEALMTMASEGIIEEEKIDSFNVPYYAPSPEELTCVIQKEGSFVIDHLEAFEMDWDGDDSLHSFVEHQKTIEFENLTSGQRVSKTIRAVTESMLEFHFGGEIIDKLFYKYSEIVDDHLSKNRNKGIVLVVSLANKG
ncbi:jasmonate O-methyltransferase [Sarracenia purpurea var. burkii]